MRWAPLAIFMYIICLLQMTLTKTITFETLGVGPFGPDFMVCLAVFVAFWARSSTDAMVAGTIMGLLMDLTTAGGMQAPTLVGPMGIAYCISVSLVFRVREAFFRDRVFPQILICTMFCLLSHFIWITIQTIFCGTGGFKAYMNSLLLVLLSSVYTGLIAPIWLYILLKVRGVIFESISSRGARSRR